VADEDSPDAGRAGCAMKAIMRRLRRLELNVGVCQSDEPNVAEIIYERRRRRLAASGLPCEEHPPGYFRRGAGSEVIDADELRNALTRRRAEAVLAEQAP
jgi:hypothetical protein